jgi:hypothetical protein
VRVFVFIAVAVVLLAIIVLSRPTLDVAQEIDQMGSAVEEMSTTAQDDRSAVGVIEEQPTTGRESFSEPPALAVSSNYSNLPPGFTQNPELRGAIVEFLVSSGLAESDSERTADAVLVDLKDCAEQAFGTGDTLSRDTYLEACTLSVIAAHGLPLELPGAAAQ